MSGTRVLRDQTPSWSDHGHPVVCRIYVGSRVSDFPVLSPPVLRCGDTTSDTSPVTSSSPSPKDNPFLLTDPHTGFRTFTETLPLYPSRSTPSSSQDLRSLRLEVLDASPTPRRRGLEGRGRHYRISKGRRCFGRTLRTSLISVSGRGTGVGEACRDPEGMDSQGEQPLSDLDLEKGGVEEAPRSHDASPPRATHHPEPCGM